MFVETYSYDNELITKGRQEEKIATAQAGLAKGIDLDTIAFLTKLDIETIEQLKQEATQNKGNFSVNAIRGQQAQINEKDEKHNQQESKKQQEKGM